jgi:D-3-phosphoglycerate dehydrogenase
MASAKKDEEPRIVVAFGHPFQDLAIERRILARANAQVIDGNSLAPDDATWAKTTGILLGTSARLTGAKLQECPRCRAIIRYGIGYDNIDVAAAKSLGITVGIVRDYCVDEVADHTIACALALVRNLAIWDSKVRSGRWRSAPVPAMHRTSRLCFALVGFGMIGRAVARRARALFGRVAVFDPLVTPTADDAEKGFEVLPSLADLLAVADVLSVHVPLTPETQGLIGEATLRQLKRDAFVINVSRGGIVDERALLDAIRRHELRGAALDTFVEEPLPQHSPLIDEPRILLSPHVAWLSDESVLALRTRASEEMYKALNNEPLSAPIAI